MSDFKETVRKASDKDLIALQKDIQHKLTNNPIEKPTDTTDITTRFVYALAPIVLQGYSACIVAEQQRRIEQLEEKRVKLANQTIGD